MNVFIFTDGDSANKSTPLLSSDVLKKKKASEKDISLFFFFFNWRRKKRARWILVFARLQLEPVIGLFTFAWKYGGSRCVLT